MHYYNVKLEWDTKEDFRIVYAENKFGIYVEKEEISSINLIIAKSRGQVIHLDKIRIL
jgi:hypothetical protein